MRVDRDSAPNEFAIACQARRERTIGTEAEVNLRRLGIWKAAQCFPEISRKARTLSKMPKRDRICSRAGQ